MSVYCNCFCQFSYSLTLIDALDTLAVMGNYTEFRRVAQLLTSTLDFDRDINVSVFETNIRGMCSTQF
jgi:ER degradation enhancer, mannosidase alpha-like 2